MKPVLNITYLGLGLQQKTIVEHPVLLVCRRSTEQLCMWKRYHWFYAGEANPDAGTD